MSEPKHESPLVGAHMSISGGLHLALERGAEFGCTTIQVFTRNQKQWNHKPLEKEEIALWNAARAETGIREIMCHDSYLINLGCPNSENLKKSQDAFEREIKRCQALDIDYLNFHPGAHLKDTEEKCIEQIAKSINKFADLTNGGKTRLLIETTAGQGTNVGHRFEQIAAIIALVDKKVPIGVCMDTCHTFAAGYDITTKSGWDKTLKEFDDVIGLKYLYAFHLNDSKHPLGSRKDRHENLGKGHIGIECFKVMMTHPKMKHLPKYLETPDGDLHWNDEINQLKKFAKGS